MSARIAILASALLASVACNDDKPMNLQVALTTGSDQSCPSQSCTEIPVACAAVLSVRILSPDTPDQAFISVCQQIQLDHDMDFCSISSVPLPSGTELPNETLEVQVAIYPLSDIPVDPTTGDLDCPTSIVYSDASGFPENASPAPAVGGRAYYHPNDALTTVELGCTDLAALDAPSCTGVTGVAITASVDDYDTEIDVPPSIADLLTVSVGEPQPMPDSTGSGTIYVLDPTNAFPLDLTVVGPTPEWGGNVDIAFQNAACLEVLEDGAEETTALACRAVTAGVTTLDLHGVRLAKSSLQEVLTAVGDTDFPDDGVVVGMVLDDVGNPDPNIAVVPMSPTGTTPTVQYLSADRSTVVTGGIATTSSGVFVSPDAPFGTTWTTKGGPAQEVANAYGGLVESKVSIVVLQLAPPVIGP